MPAIVSFVMPVHDAVETLTDAVEHALHAELGHPDLKREIIVVDDASTDGTTDCLRRLSARGLTRACYHAEHLGHGAAISTGLATVSGDIVVVADGSLSYDPAETDRLLAPIVAGKADVVYGSRYVATSREVPQLWDRMADRVVTAMSNGLNNVALTDLTTTFLAFRTDVVRGAVLRADGYGVAAELAALFTSRRARIFEVSVSYRTGRRPSQSRWLQGLAQIAMMARCRFRSWQLDPVVPHSALPASMPAVARGARLTRLVRPIDLMPITPTAARPMLRAN